MKVFVTGIAGFLGSFIAEEFLKLGFDVSGGDNLVGGYKDNVPEKATFYEIDFNNFDSVLEATKGADIIYHTACTAYEGLSVFSPSLITQNTYQISVNLMTAAVINKAQRFIHCSSMARYGSQDTQPFHEQMICRPQDPYGIAKYAAELTLTNISQTHGLDLVIAVPHNIVGPRQKYDDPFRNVASIMINLMLQGRQPIIYGDGMQTRCFSDIRDELDCLVKFATESSAVGEIFNIGPDEEVVTINDLAKQIAELLSFDLDPIFVEGRPQEVKHAHCSADKIREYFDYQTKFSLIDTLESLIEYIKDRGVKQFEYHLPIEIKNDLLPSSWKNKLF